MVNNINRDMQELIDMTNFKSLPQDFKNKFIIKGE